MTQEAYSLGVDDLPGVGDDQIVHEPTDVRPAGGTGVLPVVQVGGEGFPEITYYLMRGINAGNNYVHWRVTKSPDLTATYAPEAIPDLSTVTIAAQW